jgi:hypothetical protein
MVFKRGYEYGAVQYRVPADVVGGVLEEIEARDGAVTKEAFLEESRPEDAPTHRMFEWDDAKAAEKYRLVQSKNIINNLKVVIQKNDEEPMALKAFVNVSSGSQFSSGRYIRVEAAIADDRSRGVMFRNALAELGSFKRKYRELTELEDIFRAIEALGA